MDKLDQFLAYLKHERQALPHSVISYKSDLSMMLNYFKERNIELENERDKERRERDSNPRSGCPESDFQDRRLKPLGHPSKDLYFNLRSDV